MMPLLDKDSLAARMGMAAAVATALVGGLGFYAGSTLQADGLATAGAMVAGVCIGIGLVLWAVKSGMVPPVRVLRESLQSISEGRLGGNLPYATQSGEIGALAASVATLQSRIAHLQMIQGQRDAA